MNKVLLAWVVLFVAVWSGWSEEPKDLAKHFMLKHYIGSWEAEGTLKNKDGQDITLTESWSGKVDGPGAFCIEGSRTLNGDTQSFKWTITHNPATDSFEAILLGQDGNQLRFEAQFSEADVTLELKAVTGNGDGAVTVKEKFDGEGKDVIESEITVRGDDGQMTLQGTISHKRLKSA
jgi:hypothetical protein